jgi:glycosyltransferase involved in cell wall biosynthesis
MPRVIIVVPCYNEFARLPVDVFKEYVMRGQPHTVLFVDDGSTDGTGDLLDDMQAVDNRAFQVLRLPRNVGKAEAVRQGFLAARAEGPDYIGYWDADLATPLDAIPEFCRVLDDAPGVEIVMGARVILLGHRIERKLIRHYIGRVFATAASFVLGFRVYDVLCGAKLFRVSPRTAALFSEAFRCRWIFDVEWLARYRYKVSDAAHPCGGIDASIREIPLREWREVAGSKLRWHDFLRAAFDLAGIFLQYRCAWLRRADPSEAPVVVSTPVIGRATGEPLTTWRDGEP